MTQDQGDPGLRVGVLVVAYNAATTLASVLDRLPDTFRARVDHVLVCDDASQDATHLVALGYQTISDLPLTVIRHPKNLGYGGNQKAGYKWAIEHGLDVVVLLHGDGQYQPECIESLVEPIERGDADAVFGSRMLVKGGARKGGMPMYKWVGNKILTTLENRIAGMDLSEWHSGYRAYRVESLAAIDLDANSDGFDSDTQIILQFHDAGMRIGEVPIPTYYGDEICHVNGMKYARDILGHVTRYRISAMGFGGGLSDQEGPYESKLDAMSSHGRLISSMANRHRSKVLDLGCADGALAEELTRQGHEVTGVDLTKHDGVGARMSSFVEADLNEGVPVEVGAAYDVIVAAHVLEHLVRPDHLLAELPGRLRSGGTVLVSVPNVAHWYPRVRIAAGRFDYDRRGILDASHVRFFTRRSFTRIARRAGLSVRRCTAIGSPTEVLNRGTARPRRTPRVSSVLDRIGLSLLPGLFAYQYLFELEPDRAHRI